MEKWEEHFDKVYWINKEEARTPFAIGWRDGEAAATARLAPVIEAAEAVIAKWYGGHATSVTSSPGNVVGEIDALFCALSTISAAGVEE